MLWEKNTYKSYLKKWYFHIVSTTIETHVLRFRLLFRWYKSYNVYIVLNSLWFIIIWKRWFMYKIQNGYNLINESCAQRLIYNSIATSKICPLWVGLYVNLYQLPVQLLQFIVGLETMSGVKWSLLVIMYQPSLASGSWRHFASEIISRPFNIFMLSSMQFRNLFAYETTRQFIHFL